MAEPTLALGALVLSVEPWAQGAATWAAVEAAGFDVAYAADHLTHPRLAGRWVGDPWATLAAAAAVTSRVRLGTLVASAAIRSPAPLARAAATVHDVSGGRLVLGIGAGAVADAAAERGERPEPAGMALRFEEVLTATRALLAGEPTWVGTTVAARDVSFAPLPPGLDAPPIVVAAHGPRSIGLAVRLGDGWTTYGGPAAATLPRAELWDVIARQRARVDAACEREGRDPRTLHRSVLLGYAPDDDPLESDDAFRVAAEQAVEHGFDELVVYWPVGQPDADRLSADAVPEAVASLRTAIKASGSAEHGTGLPRS